MNAAEIPMLDLHSALSRLSYAVKLELEPVCADIVVEWREGTHLAVRVSANKRFKQLIIDRLTRGAIQRDYDYRFSGVSYSLDDETEWQTVMAYVDLHHPRKVEAA